MLSQEWGIEMNEVVYQSIKTMKAESRLSDSSSGSIPYQLDELGQVF